jgi:hypothetical protein
MSASTDVALILWNADVIDLMSFVLLRRNITSEGIEPSQAIDRIADFIALHTPAVVVYDLEPPYGLSAARFLSLLDRFSKCSFVITCADRALALHSAPWLSAVPVFQKPYVLDEIADSVSSRVMRISLKLAPVYLGI